MQFYTYSFDFANYGTEYGITSREGLAAMFHNIASDTAAEEEKPLPGYLADALAGGCPGNIIDAFGVWQEESGDDILLDKYAAFPQEHFIQWEEAAALTAAHEKALMVLHSVQAGALDGSLAKNPATWRTAAEEAIAALSTL